MGVHPAINLGRGKFPRQGMHHLARVAVCFHYDSSREFPGTIVRDDAEDPLRTIIAIDDGPVVLATECHYRIVEAPSPA